jgi:site-specific DNA recombinase
LILTKSVSRLARNAELLLSLLRELKELHVWVVFEEQLIDTRTATGELMITLLASYAEAERKSQSASV